MKKILFLFFSFSALTSFSQENKPQVYSVMYIMVGGHLEPGTKSLTFFMITIGVLPDNIDIGNFDSYKVQQ